MTEQQTAPAQLGTPVHVWRLFVHWYVFEQPQHLLQSYIAYAEALFEMISYPYILRTLFAPWKAIRDAYPRKGLHLDRILETWTLNLTARIIGLIVRIVAMLFGLLLQGLLLTGFTLYGVVWFAFPLLLACLIPYLIVAFLL